MPTAVGGDLHDGVVHSIDDEERGGSGGPPAEASRGRASGRGMVAGGRTPLDDSLASTASRDSVRARCCTDTGAL